MRAAAEHGRRLPSFRSLEEAKVALFKQRDEDLEYLKSQYHEALEFSPDSLKTVEAWYFSHFADGAERHGTLVRSRVELALAVYLGEVLVRSDARFQWAVEPFPFTPGTYELTVSRPLVQIGIGGMRDLFARPGNARRQSIYREFKRYAG
jgi:hypothetical protein